MTIWKAVQVCFGPAFLRVDRSQARQIESIKLSALGKPSRKVLTSSVCSAREFVRTKKHGGRPASSAVKLPTLHSVRTATPCTVCVPVGSSSNTTMTGRARFFAPTASWISGRGSSGHSGGRSARVLWRERVGVDEGDKEGAAAGFEGLGGRGAAAETPASFS